MTRMFWLLVCALVLPSLGQASPWPRETGTWFVSTSVEISERPEPFYPDDTYIHQYSSSYIEYGLTPRISLGAKGNYDPVGVLDGEVFVGVGLLQKGPHALSLELGATYRHEQRYTGEILGSSGASVGLAYGRGLTLFGAGGWASVELHQKIAEHGRETKLDTTLGLSFESGWLAMVQTFTSLIDGRAETTFAPTLVFPMGEKNKIAVGLRQPLFDAGHEAMMVGFWQEF